MIKALLLLVLAGGTREEFDQAVAAFSMGLYGPALSALEGLLLEPEFEEADSAYLIAGEAAFELTRYEKALRYLESHLAEATEPGPKSLEKAVTSALELNQALKGYSLFAAYPRQALTQDTKLRLAQALTDLEKYAEARNVYMEIDDCEIRLVGAKMLLDAGRHDLLGPYLADLELTCPEVAEEIRKLQLEQSISRGDSLASLETGIAIKDPFSIGAVEAHTLGSLFQSFSLFEEAQEFFSSAVKQRRYNALLPLAQCYAASGDNRNAVKTFHEAQEKLSLSADDRATQARVRLLTGEDYDAKSLVDARFRGFDEYRLALELIEDASEYLVYERLLVSSPFVRSSLVLRRARLLGLQQRFEEALIEYEKYLQDAPFANQRDEAAREADIIINFEIKDAEAALKKFVTAATSSEKGKILFEDAKDYEGAIEFLDTVSTAQSFYYSALSYERLYERDGKIKYLDKARERYENLYWQFPEDRLVEDALYRLFVTEIRDPLKRVDRALDYIDHYPEGKYADEITFRLGYVEIARGDTVAAQNDWETLYLTRPKSPYNYPVLFELARLSQAASDTTDAAAKFSLIVSVAPHDTLYFLALREMALLEESRGRNVEALTHYRRLAKECEYFPSELWERTLDLIFSLRQYKELDYFRGVLKDREYLDDIEFYKDAAKVDAREVEKKDLERLFRNRPAARKDEYLYWTGVGAYVVGYERLSRHLLERVVSEGHDSLLTAKADFLVAQIQMRMPEDTTEVTSAVEKLRRLHAKNPHDTLVLEQLVRALYRAGELEEADSLWRKLDYLSTDKSRILLEKVAWLLNNQKVEEADSVLTFLSNVRTLWKNDQFLYYKGLIAAMQGREEEAVEMFKMLISDFEKSEFVGLAHFRLATLYHIQEDYDNAVAHYLAVLEYPDLRRDALVNLAKLERKRKDFDKAVEYFELLAQEATSPEERGEWYLEMGVTSYHAAGYYRSISYLERSIVYLERALPLVSEQRSYLLYCTARSYAGFLDDEHLERGVSVFLQCHDEFPQDQWGLECWFQAGVGYLELEQPDKAKEIFTAILNSRGEDDPFGMRAREELDKLE
ncbi:tetratricopeptide repeat protein [candidate division WOR-3 bacterium]|nr:tetratricopeptide repeat protein [candidate division WOR-3 bacterium]